MPLKKSRTTAKQLKSREIAMYSHQTRTPGFNKFTKEIEDMIAMIFKKGIKYEKKTYNNKLDLLSDQLGHIYKRIEASNLTETEKIALAKVIENKVKSYDIYNLK